MEKEFVTYEQSLALKELGFNEDCLVYFNSQGSLSTHSDEYEVYLINNDKWISSACSAPIKQQVFRWFRNEYKIQSLIQEYLLNTYMYTIDDGINNDISIVGFESYEEAELACIDKLIEIIKKSTKDKEK